MSRYASLPEDRKEAHRAAMRRNWAKQYEATRAAGLCIRGCGEKADPGMLSCAACRQLRKERNALKGDEDGRIEQG